MLSTSLNESRMKTNQLLQAFFLFTQFSYLEKTYTTTAREPSIYVNEFPYESRTEEIRRGAYSIRLTKPTQKMWQLFWFPKRANKHKLLFWEYNCHNKLKTILFYQNCFNLSRQSEIIFSTLCWSLCSKDNIQTIAFIQFSAYIYRQSLIFFINTVLSCAWYCSFVD